MRESNTPSINTRSSDWIELRVWLTKRAEQLKTQVMDGELSDTGTAVLRGQYKMLREILSLEKLIETKRNQQAQ